MGLLEMQAGAKVPLHRDATEEYIHILQGSGDITINGKTTKIQKGDTVYMPANAEVTFKIAISRLRLKFCWPSTCGQIYKMAYGSEITTPFVWAKDRDSKTGGITSTQK